MDAIPNTQAADGVSLGPVPALAPDTGVSLASPEGAPVVTDEIASVRAPKVHEAIGAHLDMSASDIKDQILAGKEQTLRNTAAASLNAQRERDKINSLSTAAVAKGAPLDENDVNRILDPFNPNNKPVDPDSVVESQYAIKYIGSIQQAIDAVPGTPVGDAQNEIPQQDILAKRKGSILTAKMEVANKLQEDSGVEFSQQSMLSKGWDIAKTMWQPYSEYEMRGLTPGVGGMSGGVLLGSNLQAQADAIVAIPDIDDYTKTLKAAVAPLTPVMRMRFLDYVKGLPKTDMYLDNAFTLMAPLDYAAIGKGAVGAARKVDMFNRTNTAVRTMVQNADKVGTDAALRAEVTGNLDGAATNTSTNIALSRLDGTGDAQKVATDDTLLTFMNQDKDKIAASPGNLRREQVTRIQDQFDGAGTGLLQRITDAARINRTPMALATQNAINIIKDTVKDYYSGIRNSILDVSEPLYEPRSNTYWFETTIGNHDGSLFSNKDTASNFAKQYGMEDAKFIEGNGPLTNPDTQRLLDQRTQLQKNINDAEASIQTHKKTLSDDKATPEAKADAKEQHDGLLGHKKGFEKALNETDLRLQGNAIYNRVSTLQNQIDLAAAYNKDARSRLNKGPAITAEDRQILTDSVSANDTRIKANKDELKAINTGKASVIGSNATTIQQHGVGFKIVVRRPLVETDRAVRDLLIRDPSGKLIPDAISTSSSTGFKSLFNAAVGKFRGADDTLALNESIQRKVGTYTQSLFKEWAQHEASYIKQLASGVIRKDPVTGENIPYWKAKPVALWNTITRTRHQEYNEFARTLDHARSATDPVTGKPGYFFETPAELQNHYQTNFARDPSYAEHEGYFAFKRMVEGDRIWREISEFRNRARLGVEQFQLGMRKEGKPTSSDWFDGRIKKEFPGGDDVMMIMGQKSGDERLVNLGGAGMTPRQIEEYREGVKTGKYRVIEVYAPEHKPLANFSDVAGDDHVRYILTEKAQSKPIEFNHVNRRGGGHFEYDYDHFLKQANMYHQYENVNGVRGKYKSVYTGDTTFMPVLNRVMGNDIASKMHEVQRFLRLGDVANARDYTMHNLPIEFDKLHDMFKPGRDGAGRVTKPQLDLHEPFVVVPNGKSVQDMSEGLQKRYGTSFKDAARSGSLNKQFQVAYNTERESFGLTHLEDKGTQGNPLYKYAPEAKMIDPITTMNRALNRITNTVFMDDYKIYAVEHWMREAEEHLEPIRAEVSRSSPFWVFNSANDKTAFRSGTPQDVVSNLLSNRFKIQQFVGIPNKVDTALQTVKQYLIDSFYERFGPEEGRTLTQKAITAVPLYAVNHIKDPITFLRSMTFHEKLGIFNPSQLLVQAQTFATILSVSPKHGVSGTLATLLHQWARFNKNPEIIKSLDNIASKLSGFKPGEFTEAMSTLNKTGFEKVAGEYANLNTALKTDFVGNDFKNFLDAGTFFFREGEKSTRLGAWYTAFREFRDANPTGAITKTDIGKILNRADLLTANMSRASSSMLHQGIFSLPTQFLTYQLRMAELFMGTRLADTRAERVMARLRMITYYSALYGAPSAIGLTGLPMANSIREEAVQRGYVVGENWLKTAVMEGLPSIGLHFITGGNNYNVGDRYGSPGFTQFSEALKSDAPWWHIVGGASGSTLINQLASQSNFWHAMAYQAFRPNNEKPFPLKLDDFVDMFKEISSVNQAWKMYAALNTGKWMSKNEGYVGDVSKWNAAFMATTGLSPQESDDSFLKADIKKGEIEYQKHLLGQFVKEQQRGYEAAKNQDWNNSKAYHTRAQTMLEIGGFPDDKKATAYAIATKGWESMVSDENYAFAFKNVPNSRSTFLGVPMPFTTQSNIPDTRREQYRTQKQINNQQGQ